ncbi:NADH-quinone oxidoreductase subunit C [Rhodoferax sp.]|uniref:hydrogenase large subunit n=1 Tax=Rhodoferax sp. TaxID=50421 RepID=UPI002637A7B6|nr:NADH-quinone oxidoreductase subunit C [Rhodoferax sp.]MDD2809983.1 NADH-quinone oxidoreductase subunit C [Rhodoferax sp.]
MTHTILPLPTMSALNAVSMPSTAPLQPLLQCDLSHHSLLSIKELVEQCRQALEANSTLISWFGRASVSGEPAGTVVTAVLLPSGQPLQVLRGHAEPGQSYPSMSVQFPAAQIYERELWEQTGLVPQGHPWLKPVRFEGQRQTHMADYPFFKMRGAEVHEVAVGPIHAGVIEPGHFRFMCHGEQVYHLEIQLGYQHRAVEALLLQRPPERLSPLVESVVGDSVVAYTWAFNAALESMANKPAAPTTIASRAIGLELERVAMHLATLTGLATDIAYLQPAGTYQRLRTAIINASQRVCGNRFGKGWIRPGAAAAITEALRTDVLNTLRAFLPDFQQVNALMRTSRSVQARFQGIGTVSAQTARELGLTGVVARASGLQLDLRHALPGTAYGAAPVQPQTQLSGDCWARMCQRMAEAEASTQWLLALLAHPAFNLADTPAPFAPLASAGCQTWPLQANALCVSLVEGVRGPVLVALETNAQGQLIHAKVQDPSLANWFGLAFALRRQAISDFPICNKSFDLSYCGNDL